MLEISRENEISQSHVDIPEEEILEYRAAFDLFDKDRTGSIKSKEFLKVLKSLGQSVTKDEAKSILYDLDQENCGEIQFEQFISYMLKIREQEEIDEEEEVIRAFQSFDINKDDVISALEFRHILCDFGQIRFTQEEVDEIFQETHIDNDEQLNYRELVRILRSN